jgi:hypothetical protein
MKSSQFEKISYTHLSWVTNRLVILVFEILTLRCRINLCLKCSFVDIYKTSRAILGEGKEADMFALTYDTSTTHEVLQIGSCASQEEQSFYKKVLSFTCS